MLGHLLRSKGVGNLLRRGMAIVSRTGLRPARMHRALLDFADLLARYGARATFPVTAVALSRHPGLFRQLLTRAPTVEFAIHGRRHVDLRLVSHGEQMAEITQAAACFRAEGIPFAGFRAPYLRWNDELLEALQSAGLWYDSSQCLLWPVLDETSMSTEQSQCVRLLCDFCQPLPSQEYPALPFWVGNLLEIPVSLPDDEMLIERMRIRDKAQIAKVWTTVLDLCHERGELFVLQLHPERFPLCAHGLETVLRSAQAHRPRVWLTNLTAVTSWWRLRRTFQLELVPVDTGWWEVMAEGPERATLLMRGADTDVNSESWKDPYRRVAHRRFRVRSDVRPGVGVSPTAPLELVQFLADEGYAVEITSRSEGHTVYVDCDSFDRREMLPLLEQIESAPGPLVRWARWPEGTSSALAITGDVDAVTTWDYLVRPFER